MEKQFTAVEWFNQELIDRQNGNGDSRSRDEIFEEAKQLEHAQHQLLKMQKSESLKMPEYDLDELAEEFAKNHSIYPTAKDDTEYGFKHGFQKAIELLTFKSE